MGMNEIGFTELPVPLSYLRKCIRKESKEMLRMNDCRHKNGFPFNNGFIENHTFRCKLIEIWNWVREI